MQAGASLSARATSLGYNSRNNTAISSLWGGDTGLYRRTISLSYSSHSVSYATPKNDLTRTALTSLAARGGGA